MLKNRTTHWGVIYLLKHNDQFWLRTVSASDRPTCETLTRLPESSQLIHIVYTDSVPYVTDKLKKRFSWEALDERHYRLSDVDVAYMQSVFSHPPMMVLRNVLPDVPYAERFEVYQHLQDRLVTSKPASAV
jgi:hypothetical protein